MVYALVFIGRSGEPFPDGIEIYALPDALEPLNEADLDTDLWALLRWIIEGTGGEWRVEDLTRPEGCIGWPPPARDSKAAALVLLFAGTRLPFLFMP